MTSPSLSCHDESDHMNETTSPQSQQPVVPTNPVLQQSPPPPNPPQQKAKNVWKKPLITALGIFVGLSIVFMLWFIFFGGNKNKTAQTIEQAVMPQVITKIITDKIIITPTSAPATTVTGTIDFEGYAPPDSYIAISERMQGRTDFRDVVSGLVPGKDTTWVWKDATHGTNYEIKALLKVRGKELQESTLTNISAPATGVALTIASEQKPQQPQQVAIAGFINVDGYIPQGSTLTVLTRPTGKGNFTPAVSGLPAQDNTRWSWNSAISGTTYDISVQMQNPTGGLISSNVSKTITAPAAGLLFSVSSTAQPPAPAITGVSGTIAVNGDILSNSYITLGTRKTGTASFTQAASNLSATNGVSWNWNGAQSGQQYDIQAYLWVNGQPFAQSSILTLTAPSDNNQLTINAQQQIAAPAGGTINTSCNGQQNSNFQVTINYNTNANVQNAQQYRVVVTQASNGNQVINTTLTPGSPNQQQTLTTGYQFISGTTYYAQYAYSTNSNSFSPLSPSVQFSCQ